MKFLTAMFIALAFGTASVASAGMQGQGGKPDAQKPEFKEQNPGDTSGKQEPAPTGMKEQKGAAGIEKGVTKKDMKKKGAADSKPVLPVKKDIQN